MFDSRMARLQALKASPWQTVSNFLVRAVSRMALRHTVVPRRGAVASWVRGCWVGRRCRPDIGEDPKFPVLLRSRAVQGPALVGQGAG